MLNLSKLLRRPTSDDFQFKLVPSDAVLQCLPDAKGAVRIESDGDAEMMTIRITGLPPQTAFDVFVIQTPNFPFGLSWYQGDMQTNARGVGKARFVGRFNEETFVVAPGVAPAPVVHDDAFPDADLTPQTAPVHTYHLGLWFNSAEDGCSQSRLSGWRHPFQRRAPRGNSGAEYQ